MDCLHCHREGNDDIPISTSFLKQLQQTDNLSIRFMGGEPTLYMDKIETFVNALPNANFAIMTNGINLQNYLNYFELNNFKIITSYDGTNSNRPLNTLENFKNCKEVPIISSTIYKHNINLKSLFDGLSNESKKIERPLTSYPHIAHCINKFNPNVHLDLDDARNLAKQIIEYIDKFFDAFATGIVIPELLATMQFIYKQFNNNYQFGETKCCNRNSKRCDCSGQCYTCLYKRDGPITSWEDQKEIIRSKFPECENCEYYSKCGAACIMSITHEVECTIYKPILKHFKKALDNTQGIL